MANYYVTTASNGGTVKKGKKKELEAYIERWGFSGEGDMTVNVDEDTKGNGFLNIYGYDDFAPFPVVTKEQAEEDEDLEEGDMDYDAGCDPEAFLEGLAPFLKAQGKGKDKNLIVVQTVGSEKCCFPLGAGEFILRPNGKVDFNGFKGF